MSYINQTIGIGSDFPIQPISLCQLSAAGGLLHALILGSDKVAATVIEVINFTIAHHSSDLIKLVLKCQICWCLFQKLDQNYAGSTFRLQAWTLEAPVMDINGNRISIHVNGRADISAILPSGEKHNLLQTELVSCHCFLFQNTSQKAWHKSYSLQSVNVTVSAFMDGNRIKYNIVDIRWVGFLFDMLTVAHYAVQVWAMLCEV